MLKQASTVWLRHSSKASFHKCDLGSNYTRFLGEVARRTVTVKAVSDDWAYLWRRGRAESANKLKPPLRRRGVCPRLMTLSQFTGKSKGNTTEGCDIRNGCVGGME